jgi:hypothetical protein
MILTALPYFYGYISTPVGKQFTGILLNTQDVSQYFSWARESTHSFLVENKLTPEPNPAIYFNLFWFLEGRLAVLLNAGFAETLQILRPLAGVLFLAGTFWFCSLLARNRQEQWVSFLVVSLGGGLGWIWVLVKPFTGELSFPFDIYVNEPNTFFTVMAFPFAAVAGGLLVIIFGMSALAFERSSFKWAAGAGILALILGLQHGYDLIVVYAIVGIATLILGLRNQFRWRPFFLGATICVPSLPAAFYVFYLGRSSSTWSGVLAQYDNAGVYTPDFLHLFVLMGIPLLLIVLGYRYGEQSQRRGVRELILGSWLVVGFLLLYIPTDFQIKMLGGWQIPVGIIAARVVVQNLAASFAKRFHLTTWRAAHLLGIGLILVVLPANLYLFGWRFLDLSRHNYPFYLQSDDVAATRWLEHNSNPDDVVLSSLTIGQFIPSMSGNKAFLAHWAQTLDFYTKRDLVTAFFSEQTDAERRTMLNRYQVRYVFYGEPERALGKFDPKQSTELKEVFTSPHTSIYETVTH